MRMISNWTLIITGISVVTPAICQETKTTQKTMEVPGDEFPDRPNILWITCEDISPYLGSYGCKYADTPNLDSLAARGIRYTNAFANAPVCAVARSAILTGMHSTTIGTHQMRTRTQLPSAIPAYSRIFKEAGYYTTNNAKTDYNSSFEGDSSLWDESSRTAHYRNRAKGQPFFAVFNNFVTHESQLAANRIEHYVSQGSIPGHCRIDPEELVLPPYHPDLLEIRTDWARFHDLITLMDQMTGRLLEELEDEGLADNTIVFFYSDHGGMLARSKRFIYNAGTQVPLIIYLPERWQHLSDIKPGGTDSRMVSFVDLAPTVLSIAGLEVPEIMQGTVFLGPKAGKKADFTYFYRDRMGERIDFSRAITDGRYYFVRHFNPHRPEGRDSRYGFQMQANWGAWESAYEQGLCNTLQSNFFQPKNVVDLFDTTKDQWHVVNLAEEHAHRRQVTSLSNELDRWMIETRDIGLIPEAMFHKLAGPGMAYPTIYDYAQSNDYPVATILDAAKQAAEGRLEYLSDYLGILSHNHPVLRFWGAYGLFQLKSDLPIVRKALLDMMQTDTYAANRIMAAQALAWCGDPDKAFHSLLQEANKASVGYVMLQALNALQYSMTDNRLRMEDWERFREKKFKNDYGAQFARRIIDDAIELYPERREVF